MNEELQDALIDVYDWVLPRSPNELVILSSMDVLRGLCIRIGKRTGLTPMYDMLYSISKALNPHFAKGGHKVWVKMGLIRVRSRLHKEALAHLGVPTDGGLLILNTANWQGWGASANKWHYWLDYGSEWYEKMRRDAETWSRVMDGLRDLDNA